MIDLLQIAGSIGGAGAVFGIIVFFMYRQDRRASEKRLTHLLEQDQESRQENTRVLSELRILIERLNGKNK